MFAADEIAKEMIFPWIAGQIVSRNVIENTAQRAIINQGNTVSL